MEDMAAMVPAAHIILQGQNQDRAVRTRTRQETLGRTGDSPRLGAEGVPAQLQQLEAQTQQNRVLLPNGPHQDAEEDRLAETRRDVLIPGRPRTPGDGPGSYLSNDGEDSHHGDEGSDGFRRKMDHLERRETAKG